MEATQMLATVLLEQRRILARRHRWWLAVLCIFLAIPLGAGAASLLRPQPLLNPSSSTQAKVAPKDTAERQYWSAMFNPSEEAWKAVELHFPPSRISKDPDSILWVRRANKRLGEYYLNAGELEKALAVYRKLAEVEETAQEFRITGLAGEAIVYHRRNQPEEVRARLEEIMEKENRARLDSFHRAEVDLIYPQYIP